MYHKKLNNHTIIFLNKNLVGPTRCTYKCVATDFEGVVCVSFRNGVRREMPNECQFKTARKCSTPGITMTRGRCLGEWKLY